MKGAKMQVVERTAGNVRLHEMIERDKGYELIVTRVVQSRKPKKGVVGFFLGLDEDITEEKSERWFSEYGSMWYLMPSGLCARRVSEYLNENLNTLFREEYASRRMFEETA